MQWVSDYNFDKEDKEAEHVLVLGDALCVPVPWWSAPERRCADEVGWDPTEPTRFGVYAHRLWDGCWPTRRSSIDDGPAPRHPQPFDVCGELPTGMTLLQASAGTGKTFTIAALTTRYVAEGVLPIDRLLVITFTRMATGELRERVRERLVRAFDGLVDILAGQGGHEDDEIVQLLARGPVRRGGGPP